MAAAGTLRPLAAPDLGYSGGPLSTQSGRKLIRQSALDSARGDYRFHLFWVSHTQE